MGRLGRGVIAGAVLALGACAGPGEEGGIYDPLEPVNRVILDINDGIDTVILRPAGEIYRFVVPELARDMVQSGLRHIKTPVILLNEALQGDWEGVSYTSERFMINTILGVGGLIDVAGHIDKPFKDEDFGQTLAVWGVEPGPYLVLPLFGPSTLRDAGGMVIDTAADPLGWYARLEPVDGITYGRAGAEAVDTRSRFIEEFDELKASSFDLYASLRSIYAQRRAAEIADGAVVPDFPTYDDEDGADE